MSFGSDIKGCATVEEMGEIFVGGFREENLRVRRMIQDHFALHGICVLNFDEISFFSFSLLAFGMCLVAEKTNRSAQLRLMLLCGL